MQMHVAFSRFGLGAFNAIATLSDTVLILLLKETLVYVVLSRQR